MKRISLIALAFMFSACSGSSKSFPTDECGDVRLVEEIFYGTSDPTHVPLTAGQILSAGEVPNCSATLIAPNWVLTAAHCGLRVGDPFCVGVNPADANVCSPSVRVENHPTADMTIMELAQPMTELMPGIEPIPIMTETMRSQDWVGQTAEAAGYGTTENDGYGERFFVAEVIVGVDDDVVTVDGQGMHGVCFGDSGGPTMVIAGDDTVRVAGALSYGDASCVDMDNFTRVDNRKDWIENFTGPTQVGEGGGCGSLTDEGRCDGNVATFCVDGTLQRQTCDSGTTCGYDTAVEGFRCITGEDPCEGLNEIGVCNGSTARWCEQGQVRERDCASCGTVCQIGASGANCALF